MRSLRAGVWRLADPKISLASFAGMLLGLVAAAVDGPLHWGWAMATVLGIFAIEVAKNAFGEVVDWESGVDQAVAPGDRSPFSGGKRVLVDGLLTTGDTQAVAAVCYGVGAVIGVLAITQRDPAILPFCVLGLALAWGYHGWPFRFAYRGLGELAVGLAYGPVLVAGTYLLQRGTVPAHVWWLSATLGLLIALFLLTNEFPDYAADRAHGKRTLVVQLGRARAATVFRWLVVLTAFLIGMPPILGLTPQGAVFGMVAIPPLIQAARILRATPDQTAMIVPAQVRALLAFLLFAVGASAGLLVGR